MDPQGPDQSYAFDQLGKQVPGFYPGESVSGSAAGLRKRHLQDTSLRGFRVGSAAMLEKWALQAGKEGLQGLGCPGQRRAKGGRQAQALSHAAAEPGSLARVRRHRYLYFGRREIPGAPWCASWARCGCRPG